MIQIIFEAMFPNEIFDLIIDEVGKDRATLRTCTLVRSAWGPRSRLHLFSSITLTPFELDGSRSFSNTLRALQTQMSQTARVCVNRLVMVGHAYDERINYINTDIVRILLRLFPKITHLTLNRVQIENAEPSTSHPPRTEYLHRLEYLSLKYIYCGTGIFDILSLFGDITTTEIDECIPSFHNQVDVLRFPKIYNLVIQADVTEHFISTVLCDHKTTRLTSLLSVSFPLSSDEGQVGWDTFFSHTGKWISKIKVRLYDALFDYLDGVSLMDNDEELDAIIPADFWLSIMIWDYCAAMDTLIVQCDICTDTIEASLPKVFMHTVMLLLTDLAHSNACKHSTQGLDLTLELVVSAHLSTLTSYFENTPWERLGTALRHLRQHKKIQLKHITIVFKRFEQRTQYDAQQVEEIFDEASIILKRGFEGLCMGKDFLRLSTEILEEEDA
ncbi:hypothetical protein QCA50_014908 [Cerrena zonata]|uniref:F-box domain-containing protein n=1 Tax=Cerrena zonata TaxID=2478898 RepID=A0AAW0FX43_9APHY